MKRLNVFLMALIGGLLLGNTVKAQRFGKEAANWYFGFGAGLSFFDASGNLRNKPIAIPDGKTQAGEGSASISDPNGDLLFYTDGSAVWDSNHNIMNNGTGLRGHSSSTQSAIIVPIIGQNKYYIFNVPAQESGATKAYYSVVDLDLNMVTNKNTLLPGSTWDSSEKVAVYSKKEAISKIKF